MAKKKSGGPNKSAAIREYVTANPEAKPPEIVGAMKDQGIEVSPAFVSTIKSKTVGKSATKTGRRAGRPKKAGRPKGSTKAAVAAAPATRSSTGQGTVSVDQLLKAKKLAGELGGVSQARAALEALEKIVG